MKCVITTRVFIYIFCGLFMFSFTACIAQNADIHIGDEEPVVKGGPPPHAPAHGYRAKHRYHYYPEAYVYFDVSRKLYFYLDGNTWRISVSLPQSFHMHLGTNVTIEMDSDKPYTNHYAHKKKYPPGQTKKKKKWAKKKW